MFSSSKCVAKKDKHVGCGCFYSNDASSSANSSDVIDLMIYTANNLLDEDGYEQIFKASISFELYQCAKLLNPNITKIHFGFSCIYKDRNNDFFFTRRLDPKLKNEMPLFFYVYDNDKHKRKFVKQGCNVDLVTYVVDSTCGFLCGKICETFC